jgi:hypothetical protein
MHPAFELEEKLRAYVDHDISLQELRLWYRQAAGPIWVLPVQTREIQLATALQLCLVEFDRGDFSERQIRSHLKQVLGREWRIVVRADPDLTTSINETVVTQVATGGSSSIAVIAHQLIPTGTSS